MESCVNRTVKKKRESEGEKRDSRGKLTPENEGRTV